MMRRINREFDLLAHIVRRIKEKFNELFGSLKTRIKKRRETSKLSKAQRIHPFKSENILEKFRTGETLSIEDRIKTLENDRQTIKESLGNLSNAILQLNQRLSDLDSRLKEVEEKLASQAQPYLTCILQIG